MSVMTIRADVKPERVAEIEAAAQKMFAAIGEAQPDGVRYASCRIPGSDTFVVVLQVDDGIENPLASVPAFRDFQEGLREAMAGPPVAEPLAVVGSYRLF